MVGMVIIVFHVLFVVYEGIERMRGE